MDQDQLTSQQSSSSNDEISWWEALRQGDQAAYRLLYQTYLPGLLSYGRKLTNDEGFVEDSVHNLFLQLWHKHDRLSATTSVRFYLMRALRNEIIRNRLPPMQPVTSAEEQQWTEVAIDVRLTDAETATARVMHLKRAISQLSQRQQEAIHLRYFQQLSNQEVADIMAIDNQSVRNLLYTGLRSLKKLLTRILWLPWIALIKDGLLPGYNFFNFF